MNATRIAVIGFGFSGLMLVANLVRSATRSLEIYVIDANADGLGVAYGTSHLGHFLNVPAAKMGAFADDVGGFYAWLQMQQNYRHYAADDFVPRAIYGEYLQSIWRSTQEHAAQKKLIMHLVPSRATALVATPSPAVLTERGDAIAVDEMLLATGHEVKPIRIASSPVSIIQNPWAADVFAAAKHWPSPVLLVGAGLTAIDVLLSLRASGYGGEVIMASRHGLLPQAHGNAERALTPPPQPSPVGGGSLTLRALVQWLRAQVNESGDWRGVVDALRPHTALLWQRLSTRDQQRFLQRLMPFWNIHRHRMAPEIAAQVKAEMAAGKLHVIKSKDIDAVLKKNKITPDHAVINCTGPEMRLEKSSQALLKQLLANGLIEPHATGIGLAVDPECRAWGALYPHLSVVGSLMTGQRLESTAVPELRAQAASIAQRIVF